MRAIIQRVQQASVDVGGKTIGKISGGLMILLGIEPNDTRGDIEWLVNKVSNLRIFDDENGIMNRSLIDEKKHCLVVSQFTLFASYKKGNRPSYIRSAKPEISMPLYEYFIKRLEDKLANKVETGKFGADMQVELLNDGPVTIFIDTKNKE